MSPTTICPCRATSLYQNILSPHLSLVTDTREITHNSSKFRPKWDPSPCFEKRCNYHFGFGYRMTKSHKIGQDSIQSQSLNSYLYSIYIISSYEYQKGSEKRMLQRIRQESQWIILFSKTNPLCYLIRTLHN